MMSSTWNSAGPCPSSAPNRSARLTTCAAILASASVIFAASPAASEAVQEITTIEQGEPAPFTGDLFPIRDSIAWTIEIEGCARRAALEMEHAQLLHEVELKRLRGLAAADSRADKQRLALLTAELAATRVWYRRPLFMATIGATVAVAVLLTSTVLVQATAEVRR